MLPSIPLTCSAVTTQLLDDYLTGSMPPSQLHLIRHHLDHCRICWSKWTALRWERASSSAVYSELKHFLGDQFVEHRDASWALAEEWYHRKPGSIPEIEQFYRDAQNYIYTLAIWEGSGKRPKYVKHASPYLRQYDARGILDFGCGIGTDGLELLESGYNVLFYDFRSLSTEFLRWRLDQRGCTAEVVFAGETCSIPTFDTLWLMDVIEHLPDPMASLSPFVQKCNLLIYATDCDGNSGGRHPFHFRHSEQDLKAYFEEAGLQKACSASPLHIWCRKCSAPLPSALLRAE